jgi:hypothetical protein
MIKQIQLINGSEMINLNNNLEQIYQTLSEPFTQLEKISRKK